MMRFNSFRAQGLLITVASSSMAVLAVLLVQDAWRSTRETLIKNAQQQCATAARDLKEQYADRLSVLGTSSETLPWEAEDVSLRGLASAVLRSYEGLQGGFLLGLDKRLAGYTAQPSNGPDIGLLNDSRGAQRALLYDLAERVSRTGDVQISVATENSDLLVGAAVAIEPDSTAWVVKRLAGVNDPAAQRRRWWLAGLVLLGVVGLGAVVSISIALRSGIDTLNRGLVHLESDFSYRLPAISGDFGKVAQAVNLMAERRGTLEATVRRQERLAALGRVVAGVAHEIRNPLNSLRLTLELLDRRIRKGLAGGEEVNEAIAEVDRLAAILDRLLAFGRPELDKRSVQPLQPLFNRALRVVEDQALRKKVSVVGMLKTLQANIDSLAIEQVFINLLLNAIDASPEGATVNVEGFSDEQTVRVEVRDAGSGIPENIREHVFEPYYTTKNNGTGLGLAVSREIASHHGGSLDFSSNAGGTTFSLILRKARQETVICEQKP